MGKSGNRPGRTYLFTVDYYSTFFEVDAMGQDATSKSIINKMKHHFAKHGIPEVVISDGGPQYSSQEFSKFAKDWCFKHKVSSPGHSQSNGCAESHVKIAKRLMNKCVQFGEDPYLGLLNLRNTPTESIGTSPAQRLFGRRTRTLLPTVTALLQPSTQNSAITKAMRRQATASG